MANARLGNYVFDINPSSASWGYSLNVNKIQTYGGVVLQILSCRVDDLIISGYIPLRGGDRKVQFAEMERFEEDMRAIMEAQVGDPPRPVNFSYDEMGWNGQVYLMGYDSVTYDIQTSAAKYTLRFTVDSGFDGIVNVAGIEGIDNIPDGVGWVRNKYNTPSTAYTYEDIMNAIGNILDDIGTFSSLNPPTLYEYLEKLNETEDAKNSDEKEKKTTEKSKEEKELAKKAASVINDLIPTRSMSLFTSKEDKIVDVIAKKFDYGTTAIKRIEASFAEGGKKKK